MVDFKKAAADARVAILIPSKGRPKTLLKLFQKQPFLNTNRTFVGIEEREFVHYRRVFDCADQVRMVLYTNFEGITGVAREHLRQQALKVGTFDTFLPLDDNMFFTRASVDALVSASRAMNKMGPSIVSGEHPTAEHFQADRIAQTETIRDGKWTGRVFPHTTVIYWAIPAALYAQYRYPPDCCFDDIHLALWLMTTVPNIKFWVCRDAPFNKRRFEAGGQGDAAARAYKFGLGICRLATDFPQWMTTSIVQTRIPYLRIQKAIADGKTSFEK